MRTNVFTTVLLAAPIAMATAGETLSFDDETTRINYSLGYQIGSDFKQQRVEMNADAMVQGIQDALAGAEPRMKPDEMRATLVELKRRVVSEEQAQRREAEQKQIAEDRRFLEENAKRAGVVTTESGLQYEIIEEGSGKTPEPSDQVTVNYRGTLINGQEFDSSYRLGEPAAFPLDGVIKGWTEGLQHVKEGGVLKLYIPPQLAYGKRGPLADRTLVFEIELISIGGKEQAPTGQADDASRESAAADSH